MSTIVCITDASFKGWEEDVEAWGVDLDGFIENTGANLTEDQSTVFFPDKEKALGFVNLVSTSVEAVYMEHLD